MTFTEAAVEVLRLVGKPLHYKKITEIAIERNLLSHVGKTPEITMSSRLATVVRKDRGDAALIKVKPGVFGLREFSEEVLEAAQHESGHEYELPEEVEADAEEIAVEANEVVEASESEDEDASAEAHPGADVFPEEEDDDVLIMDKLREDEAEKKEEAKRKKRRRRRRRKGEEDEEEFDERPERSERSERGRDRRERRRERERERDRDRERRRRGSKVSGDWERAPAELEAKGGALADEIAQALGAGRRQGRRLVTVAKHLVDKGRLAGSADALGPTLAASIRADGARREARGERRRFRLRGDEVELVEWAHPRDAVRAEGDAVKAAERQRNLIRRALLNRMNELPAASLLELLATWLNAEGVHALRGVSRPGVSGGDFHLAGVLGRGQFEVPVAIVVCRGRVGVDKIVDVRGGLHHYGDAHAVWIVTLGSVDKAAWEEARASRAVPCALFDGAALTVAMEEAGVGIRRANIPLAVLDNELLEELRGPGRDAEERGRDRDGSSEQDEEEGGRRRRRRRGRRDEEEAESESESEGAEETPEDDEAVAEPSEGGRRRRRRRRGRREEAESEAPEAEEDAADEASKADGEDAAAEPEGRRRRRRRRRRGRSESDEAVDNEQSGESASDDASEEVSAGAEDDAGSEVNEVPEEVVDEAPEFDDDEVIADYDDYEDYEDPADDFDFDDEIDEESEEDIDDLDETDDAADEDDDDLEDASDDDDDDLDEADEDGDDSDFDGSDDEVDDADADEIEDEDDLDDDESDEE